MLNVSQDRSTLKVTECSRPRETRQNCPKPAFIILILYVSEYLQQSSPQHFLQLNSVFVEKVDKENLVNNTEVLKVH